MPGASRSKTSEACGVRLDTRFQRELANDLADPFIGERFGSATWLITLCLQVVIPIVTFRSSWYQRARGAPGCRDAGLNSALNWNSTKQQKKDSCRRASQGASQGLPEPPACQVLPEAQSTDSFPEGSEPPAGAAKP